MIYSLVLRRKEKSIRLHTYCVTENTERFLLGSAAVSQFQLIRYLAPALPCDWLKRDSSSVYNHSEVLGHSTPFTFTTFLTVVSAATKNQPGLTMKNRVESHFQGVSLVSEEGGGCYFLCIHINLTENSFKTLNCCIINAVTSSGK